MKKIAMAVLAAVTCASPLLATAQNYPTKPITLIVPWPPGGNADNVGRFVGRSLAKELGQPVVINNVPGSAGNIGTQQFVRARADGYTLLLASSSTNAANPNLYPNTGFHPINDFAPIGRISSTPSLLLVPAGSRWKTMDELVKAARSEPGKLTFGSGGNGQSGHLAGELFKYTAKVDVLHVPFKGGAPAKMALMAGTIDFMFETGAVPDVKGGKVRALAVTSEKRLTYLPEVPTTAEVGYKDLRISTWLGIAAPAGTPPEIVARINAALNASLKTPELRQSIEQIGGLPGDGVTPEEFSRFWASEIARYGELIKLSGAKLD